MKISNCRAISPSKTLPGCRAFRHSDQRNVALGSRTKKFNQKIDNQKHIYVIFRLVSISSYPGCQRSSRSPAARNVRVIVLIGERPLAQAVKSFERADPITLPFISPESKFDPGNLIGRLKKRFLKRLLLVKCATILSKPVLTFNLTKLPWVLESSET